MKRYPYLLLIPLLTACASQPRDDSPTIADLAKQPPPDVPIRSAVNRDLAIQGYQAFLREAADPALKAEAMRRLADLTQEAQEDRAAQMLPADQSDQEAETAAGSPVKVLIAETAEDETTPPADPPAQPEAKLQAAAEPAPAKAESRGAAAPEVVSEGVKPNPLAEAVAKAKPVDMEESEPA